MPSRYALIRYLDVDGKTGRVGSGLIVRDCVVLTADHVAVGSKHTVETPEGRLPVKSIVRSGADDVDLAVLWLAKPVPGLSQLEYARVDRTSPTRIDECVVVGFPLWKKLGKKRVSAQVHGFVRTGEDLQVLAGGVDAQPLTLIGDRTPQEPDIPEGPVDYGYDKPWGGMSGAVVLAQGAAIGVIRSHTLSKGAHTLTVTPLTALRLLPPARYEEFCEALGIDDVGQLMTLGGTPLPPGASPVSPSSPPTVDVGAFSRKVIERYQGDLVAAGLRVPQSWDPTSLKALHQECVAGPRASIELKRAADLLEALWLAAEVLPLLRAFGGEVTSVRKLQHIYLRHVGCRPDADTLDHMLVLAASAGIAESRAAPGAGLPQNPLSPLAKFVLGIVGRWKAVTPGGVSLDDPELQDVARFLTGILGHQREDAASYLAKRVRRRSWALIEVDDPETGAPEWPAGIIVDVVHEQGDPESQRFPCEPPSRSGLEQALRDAVNWLPDGDVYVDLCLPRRWLDVGIEHWDVVEVADWCEPMSRHFEPRLRWTMHRRYPKLRDRLQERFDRVDWLADPEDIPVDATSATAEFTAWLKARDLPGVKFPPCFTGEGTADENHDPLGAMLKEGYGFVAWFRAGATDQVRQQAVRIAAGMSAPARLDELPDRLAAEWEAIRPAIIWSNPEGREDFEAPPPRLAGTRRRSTQ